MICPRCNKTLAAGTEVCPICNFHFEPGLSYENADLIGYSDEIKNPLVTKRRDKGKLPFIVVGYLAALLFLIASPLLGYYSGADSLAIYVVIGLGMAAFFSYFATSQIIRMRRGKTWDGQIIDKDMEIRRDRRQDVNTLKLLVKKEDGSETWLSYDDGPTLTRYYHIGDHIRCHKDFQFAEKYNKTKDSEVICIGCGNLNEMRLTECEDCGLPLLKYGHGQH